MQVVHWHGSCNILLFPPALSVVVLGLVAAQALGQQHPKHAHEHVEQLVARAVSGPEVSQRHAERRELQPKQGQRANSQGQGERRKART